MDAYPLRGTYSPVGDNGMPLDRPLTEAEFAILTGTESDAVQVASDVPQHSMPCTNRSWHPMPFSDANLSAIMNNASPIEICPSSLALSDRHGQAGAASSQYTLPTMQSHGSVHPRTLSASVPSHPSTVQMGGGVPSWAAWVSPGDCNLHVGTGPAAVRMRHAARPPSLPNHSCLPASVIDRARADYLEQSIFPPADLHMQGAGVRSDQMPCLDRPIQEVGDLGALCGDVPADALTSTGYQDPDIGFVWEDIPMYDSHLQHFRPPPQFPRVGGITSAPTGWQATQASSHEETPSFSTYPPIEFGSAATALNPTDLVFTNRMQPAAFFNHSTVTGVPTATQLMDGEMPASRPSQPYADSTTARTRNCSGGAGGKCPSLPETGFDGPRDPRLPTAHDQHSRTPPVCLCTPNALNDPLRDKQTRAVSAPDSGAPVTSVHSDPNIGSSMQAPSVTTSSVLLEPRSKTRV